MEKNTKIKCNEIVLHFVISNFEDKTMEQIDDELGLRATIYKRKGEIVYPRKKPFEVNKWILCHPEKEKTFEEQLLYITEKLTPKKVILTEFMKKKYYCYLSCAVYLFNKHDSTPYIKINNEFYRFNKDLGIEIEFDIFI